MGNHSMEILLVEDNPNDVELELRVFKKHNMLSKVFVVKDGVEALDYLFRTGPYGDEQNYAPPQVILLDLKLPKINGLEVVQRIRADERTKTMPVVVLSSSNKENDIVDSYQLGVNHYITKPIEFDELVRVLDELGLYGLLSNESSL